MMNEFPAAFIQAHQTIASQVDAVSTVALNGTEYLELLEAAGVEASDYPRIQAIQQHKLWDNTDSPIKPESIEATISGLKETDPSFSMDGASWTNNLSWIKGYENVLEPINSLSAKFHQLFDPLVAKDPAITQTLHYQEALLYLLLLETSCFRYWGQGTWTNYANEIHRRGEAMIEAAKQALR